MVGKHPTRLSLRGEGIMHTTLGDVADAGIERLCDIPRDGAVGLLVHFTDPRRNHVALAHYQIQRLCARLRHRPRGGR